MRVIATAIPDVRIVEPRVFTDDRGYFFESWNARALRAAGIDADVRAGQPLALAARRAARPALPGPAAAGQARARRRRRRVRRRGRPARELADVRALGRRDDCPRTTIGCCGCRPGFAHGFLVLSEFADFLYKTTDYWYPEHERTLLWNDPRACDRLAARRAADACREGCGRNAARGRGVVSVTVRRS